MLPLDNFQVVPIAPKSKEPVKGSSLSTPIAYKHRPPKTDAGLLHKFNRTVCLDFDDLEAAKALWSLTFEQITFDFCLQYGVQYTSGKPNRLKLLFALPAGFEPEQLFTFALSFEGKHVGEFRCCGRTGTSSYDVLPGSSHPDGFTYHWINNELEQLYQLPEEIAQAWLKHSEGITERAAKASGNPSYGVVAWFDDYINSGIGVVQYAMDTGYINEADGCVGSKWMYYGSSSVGTGKGHGVKETEFGTKLWSYHESDPLHGNPISPSDIARLMQCGDDWNTMLTTLSSIPEYSQYAASMVSDFTEAQLNTVSTKQYDVSDLFEEFRLTDTDVAEIKDMVFAINNILVAGRIHVFCGPTGAGKTTLMRHLLEEACDNGYKVMYVDVDSPADHYKMMKDHANKHGYEYYMPEYHPGTSVEKFVAKLDKLSRSNSDLDGHIFIIDTLKKFNDVMSKKQSKDFFKLLRRITYKGASVSLLAHTNKFKVGDETTKELIFEGVGDLKSDSDDFHYLYSDKDENTGITYVTTTPDRCRGVFEPMSFRIDADLRVTKLDEVLDLKTATAAKRAIDELFEFNTNIAEAIDNGNVVQKDIIEYCNTRFEMGRNTVHRLLKIGSKGNPSGFSVIWLSEKTDAHRGNAKTYSIVNRDVLCK